MDATPPTPRRRRLLRALLLIFTVGAAAELGFRALQPQLGVDPIRLAEYRALYSTGEHPEFAPRAYYGYAYRDSLVDVNSMGFADDEFEVDAPDGVTRVAVVGEHLGPRQGRSFLADELQEKLGPTVDVQNWTVEGWTSAETLLAYLLAVQDFEPDLLVVQLGASDVEARLCADFERDYRHYRKPWSAADAGPLESLLVSTSDLFVAWRLRGLDALPVEPLVNARRATEFDEPGPADVFERNLASLCEEAAARGTRVVLLTVAPNPRRVAGAESERVRGRLCEEHAAIARRVAEQHRCAVLDVSSIVEGLGDGADSLFAGTFEMTSYGEDAKAALLAATLIQGGIGGR